MWAWSGLSDWDTEICDVNLQDYIGEWHCWEYKFEISGAQINITEWIDGVQTRTAYGPADGITSFTKVNFSGWENTADTWNGGWYIDDVVISDSYIGPISSTNIGTGVTGAVGVGVTVNISD